MALNLDGIAKFANTLMIDECVISRKGRQEDAISANWSEATGTYSPARVPEEVVYEGKCMFYTRGVAASETEEGGQKLVVMQKFVSLPRDAVEVELKPEDEITITDIHLGGDETILGKTYLMQAVDQGTYYATRELLLMDKNMRMRT
jgi:hypothetical protein